jgi:hypothetical protein
VIQVCEITLVAMDLETDTNLEDQQNLADLSIEEERAAKKRKKSEYNKIRYQKQVAERDILQGIHDISS